jgi:hypothetical protein
MASRDMWLLTSQPAVSGHARAAEPD